MDANQLLHEIDKRLAVLEALGKEHAIGTDVQFNKIHQDLKAVNKELAHLRIRVAGVAGTISIIVGVAFRWLLQ